jgi:hypothetical protein
VVAKGLGGGEGEGDGGGDGEGDGGGLDHGPPRSVGSFLQRPAGTRCWMELSGLKDSSPIGHPWNTCVLKLSIHHMVRI